MNPELDFIHVSPVDIFGTFALMLSINLIVMITWTLVSPLEWVRVKGEERDMFERLFQSYGTCESDSSVVFAVLVIVTNVFFLILGNGWNYMSRNIETEYGESRYIGISMAATLQAWSMGIPILVVVWDNPQARFFVESGIIFVTSLAFLATVYLPKVVALRADRVKSKDTKTEAFSNYQGRARQPSDYNDEEEEEGGLYDGTLPMTILEEKKSAEAKVSLRGEDENPQDALPDYRGANDVVTFNDAEQREDMATHHDDMNGVGNDAGAKRGNRGSIFGGRARALTGSGGRIKVLHNPRVSLCLSFSALCVKEDFSHCRHLLGTL